MIQLYLTPLPEQTTDTAGDRVGSQVQQAGLLDAGGTSVENIATENVDFQKQGRIQSGPTLSRKIATELNSLSESGYKTLPLFDAAGSALGREAGYYEATQVNVTPAQEARDDVYQYDVELAKAGTREDSRRAVRTNPQAVAGAFPSDGTGPLVGIRATATDVLWYSDADGTEPASPVDTVATEFGSVNRYNPSNATASAPALTYDLPFSDDGPVDVRVLDTKGVSKITQSVTGTDVNRWTHAYHPGYQFSGPAVVDTGRIRLYLDGNPTGSNRDDIAAETYDNSTDSWTAAGLDATNPWELVDWSFRRIRPARSIVRTRWDDGTEQYQLDGHVERGAGGVTWVVPENASSPPTELTDLLGPTARTPSELAFGTQGLIARSKRND